MISNTMTTTPSPGAFLEHGLWAAQQGAGPDVLLIAGLGDPIEAWQAQLEGLCDRYRLIAFDNRGAGRSPLPGEVLTVAGMADDAAGVLRSLAEGPAHVAGFSGGAMIAQELALRHPDLVRSLVLVSTWALPDRRLLGVMRAIRWMVEAAPDDRAFLDAFLLWVYTHRAFRSGMMDQVIDEALAFPHPASAEAIQRTLDALIDHSTAGRLHAVTAPTLVLAGDEDPMTPPWYGRQVADEIPGATFEVLAGESHQPFQEQPDVFNARVDAFWREVESRTS